MKNKSRWIILIFLVSLLSAKIFSSFIFLNKEGLFEDWTILNTALAQLQEDDPGDDSISLNMQLIKSLKKKQKELDEKKDDIKEREERLKIIEQNIHTKLKQLNTIKDDIDMLIVKRDELEEASILHLAKIYKGMAPQDAAAQFDKLDHSVAIKVFTRMKSRTASKVMPFLNPALATKFGEEIVKKRLIIQEAKNKKR